MNRPFTLGPVAAALCLAVFASPAAAQFGVRTQAQVITRVAAVSQADLRGVILNEAGEPLPGAVVSALGAASAFAVSDAEGRFVFRNLPYGPYLLRAHLQGYVSGQARLVQVDRASIDVSTIALAIRPEANQPPRVLAAGVGTVGVEQPVDTKTETETIDQGEVAWRLRHLKRSVLKDESGLIDFGSGDSLLGDSLQTLSRAVGSPARLATALFSDIPFTGQVNFLTSTAFDRPQDLFSSSTGTPNGIAFVSLEAPTSGGAWAVQGAVTQGDLASWILAGSFVRNGPVAHQYETGMSYGMQRYLGGNASALAAVTDGGRNVGAVYAYDTWTINPRATVTYGATYSRYDYLAQQNLFSPRVSVVLTPTNHKNLKVRASVSRRALAPGAEEFIPPANGVWLPPERTFAPLSSSRGMTPEQLDHFEVAAERDWNSVVIGVRAFRQEINDQIITLFGATLPGLAPANVGHYFVASGGDVEAHGWGVSISRDVLPGGVRASVNYTQADATWGARGRDRRLLSSVAPQTLRDDQERIHDITTSVESVMPVTATRVFVVYKINTAFADSSSPAPGVRFDVQLNQALPFLNFTSAQWEMLLAVRNMFREELLDASVYDELMVVRPPKRVVGGVTVRF